MAKNRARGLPEDFALHAEDLAPGPVVVGDYLDEDEMPVRRERPSRPAPEPAQVERLATVPEVEAPPPAPKPVPPVARSPQERPMRREPMIKPTRLPSSVPRKQINMNTETLAMVESLLAYMRTYSVQKDLKASELFHALVLALHEAHESLDLSMLQPRGRWGTGTAAAFPVALKACIQEAIARYLSDKPA